MTASGVAAVGSESCCRSNHGWHGIIDVIVCALAIAAAAVAGFLLQILNEFANMEPATA